MNLDNALPDIEFSSAELYELAVHLSNPAVKKYLRAEQIRAFKAIANGLPKEGESDAEYLRKQAAVVGALGVFETLLKIENPQPVNQ